MVDKSHTKKHSYYLPDNQTIMSLGELQFININILQYENPCIPTDDAWCVWISDLWINCRWQQAGGSKHQTKKKTSRHQQHTCTPWGNQITKGVQGYSNKESNSIKKDYALVYERLSYENWLAYTPVLKLSN